MTVFDWVPLSAARGAQLGNVPEMINHALMVLADLLEETNHACEFTLKTGSLIGEDVAESVSRLLPAGCSVQGLHWVPRWRALVDEVLPANFLPWQPDAWSESAPPRALADSLTAWTVTLMSRLWPEDAECWKLTVGGDFYAPVYVDLVINHDERVWLLHLEVTD